MRKTIGLSTLAFTLPLMLLFGCVPATGPQPREQTGLSTNEIVAGLKEALAVGTTNAVLKTGKEDGYFGNTLIRVLLPDEIQKYEKALRLAGLGPKMDAFVLSMNRAAERAAPKAKELFINAIRQMSFQDAKQILFGPDDAATRFFKTKTEGPLTGVFKPIVHKAMGEVGVTREYQKISGQLNLLTLGGIKNLDLDAYVTAKALDGLFLMVAEEERKIRNNPVARVTELLQKVFGSR